MGFMDQITSMASQAAAGGQANAAGGMMQAIEQHPGGIQGIIDQFKQNGMGEHVNNWASQPAGETPSATPEQIQQGVGGSGLIESAAQHTGMSREMVTLAMSTLLPMVIQHYSTAGGTAQPSAMSGMASQILSRIL